MLVEQRVRRLVQRADKVTEPEAVEAFGREGAIVSEEAHGPLALRLRLGNFLRCHRHQIRRHELAIRLRNLCNLRDDGRLLLVCLLLDQVVLIRRILALKALRVRGVFLFAYHEAQDPLGRGVDSDDDRVRTAVEAPGSFLPGALRHAPHTVHFEHLTCLILFGAFIAWGCAIYAVNGRTKVALTVSLLVIPSADAIDVHKHAVTAVLLKVKDGQVLDHRVARHVAHARVLGADRMRYYEVFDRNPVRAHTPLVGVPVRAPKG